MIPPCVQAWGPTSGRAQIRCRPEDFQVSEQLGFELSGDGEHCFLYLEKRQLNTLELQQRLSALSNIAPNRIGFSGLKDRNAVTRQWFSVGLAGLGEPDWQLLESEGDVQVLDVGRHRRKLRRGVHRSNRFQLLLRSVEGERAALEARLQVLRDAGVPNYFGEQRFGRHGATLEQARRWMSHGRRVSRQKRSLYLSALRAFVFNQLLAQRVRGGDWNVICSGDVCMLQGTRSFFTCSQVSDDIGARSRRGDLHPGLPLWGRHTGQTGSTPDALQGDNLREYREICLFLERFGVELSWRPARLLPDDFSWQFCDDALQLDFALVAGGYATAILAEFVQYDDVQQADGGGSEQN